jgi:hypothetical protein
MLGDLALNAHLEIFRLGREYGRVLACGAPCRELECAMRSPRRDCRVRLSHGDTKDDECGVEELLKGQKVNQLDGTKNAHYEAVDDHAPPYLNRRARSNHGNVRDCAYGVESGALSEDA